MKTDLVKESTTLPEGIVITVARCHTQRKKDSESHGKTFTELRAERGEESVIMRVDDIAPNNLAWYLKMVLSTIERYRKLMPKGCAMIGGRAPADLAEFVAVMIDKKMFEVMQLGAVNG